MLAASAAELTAAPTVSTALAQGAVDAMMTFYDDTTGLWDPGAPWWQSGLALQAVLGFMAKTGNRDYMWEANYTIQTQRRPLAWWPAGGGEFRAESTDDTGWWALAAIAMYELTGDAELLEIARKDEEYMYRYWTDGPPCGGGLVWHVPTRSYHNAISNELYLLLTATLHNIIPGDTVYLQRSLREWDWFRRSGMINADNLVNDGLTDGAACVNNNNPTWTYNQGVILGGLVELYKATCDKSYLIAAKSIADAVVSSPALMREGILTEPCSSAGECEPDGVAFKGIFMGQLAKLDGVLVDHPYRALIRRNTEEMHSRARNEAGFYGGAWQEPFDSASIGRQASAAHLFVAALDD